MLLFLILVIGSGSWLVERPLNERCSELQQMPYQHDWLGLDGYGTWQFLHLRACYASTHHRQIQKIQTELHQQFQRKIESV